MFKPRLHEPPLEIGRNYHPLFRTFFSPVQLFDYVEVS